MEIIRLPISEIKPAEYNPRKDLKPTDREYKQLKKSIEEFGFVETLVWNKRTGNLISGHQRLKILKELGVKEIEVSVVDLPIEKEKALNVALNKIQGDWDEARLVELLLELEAQGQLNLTGFTKEDMHKLQGELELERLKKEPTPEKPRGNREYEIDLIYTFANDGTCCIATRAGFVYGIQSRAQVCPAAHRVGYVDNILRDEAWERHAVHFIDNPFKKYDHKRHLDVVAQHCPKYATVRDIMTREQCEEAGIEYYPLDQILKWAEELEKYAQNVIVVPKYDCIKDIPEKYVLGYSAPSSYGQTAMPIEKFRGRRIHILGGSPLVQYRYFQAAYEDVVSLDTNYVHKISMVGAIWGDDGVRSVTQLGVGEIVNPLYVAFAINIGKLAALYSRKPAEEDKRGDDRKEE